MNLNGFAPSNITIQFIENNGLEYLPIKVNLFKNFGSIIFGAAN